MIEVKVEGQKLAAAKIGKEMPGRLKEAQGQAMDKSVSDLKTKLKTDSATSRFTGDYSDRIITRLKGKAGDEVFKGIVESDSVHAKWVEFGRGAGKFPNLGMLRLWVQKKLNGTDADVYFIGRSIAQKGNLNNKKSGYDSGWAHLRSVVKKSDKAIRRLWQQTIERSVRLGK